MADNNYIIGVKADTKQAEKDLDKFGKKAQGTLDISAIAKKSAIGITSLAGTVAGLVAVYRKQELAEIKLEQTLKATSFAAGLSANELKNMASGLQAVTTFSDEAVLSAQTVLLRFGAIGKDIFPRAIEATLDLAQGLGTDLAGAAKTLGEALQDPIKKVAALEGAGVTFTQSQKDLIQSSISAGNSIKAQSIVLDELSKKFGGLAKEATTGSGALIQTGNLFTDIAQSGGKILLPFILKLNDALATSAKFWKEVADDIGNIPEPDKFEAIKNEIAETELELAKIEGAYKRAKQQQDNFVEIKGVQGYRNAIQKAESDIIEYGFASGDTSKQILQQWTTLTEQLNGLRKSLADGEKAEFAGSAEAQKVANQARLEEERLFNQNLATLKNEFRIIEDEARLTDLEKMENALKRQQFAEAKAQTEAIKAEKGTQTAITDIQKKAFDLRLSNAKADAQNQTALEQATANAKLNILTAFSNLATATLKDGSKVAFLIQKAAAVAQTIVATNLAAAQALAVPPAPNLFLAGLAKTAGALNLAAIAATTIKGFADGGLVEGGVRGKDSVPALLMPNELVVPRRNFDEVVNAVAAQRTNTQPVTSSMQEVIIGFRDSAFEIIESKLLERQALGV